MADNTNDRAAGPTKSFMTAGPTLHYSHTNVWLCWVTGTVVYAAACVFWARIHNGSFVINPDKILDFSVNWLHQYVTDPISIYQYPWQILILSLLMGIIGVTPILTSQLLSFRYSIPMIIVTVFFAQLPLMAIFLTIGCLAAAFRPLRFRSRFIAIAMCMAPVLVYWTVFGGGQEDPVEWGFSYAPWIGAWLVGLSMAGVVLGIGHFTRYRPGLVWSVSGIVLAIAVGVFSAKISFAELDYQLYIARNNPEEVVEFHDHDLGQYIDQMMNDENQRSYLLGLFYPIAEPILLRQKLVKEIQLELAWDRWPKWFNPPDELRYQEKRQQLINDYKIFIERWPENTKRMPIALYFYGMVNEYSPDIRLFSRTQLLRFYSDYPHHENLSIWHQLVVDFPQSPESIEARFRYAIHQAGRQQFDNATQLCDVSLAMINNYLEDLKNNTENSDSIWAAFSSSADTVMTPVKLKKLQQKILEFKELIGPQNRSDDPMSSQRLGQYVTINPYRMDYDQRLEALLNETSPNDPLRDNLRLSITMLNADTQLKTKQLLELHQNFKDSDAGKQALFELGKLKVSLWKSPDVPDEIKAKSLVDARAVLSDFLAKYPDNLFAAQAKELLSGIPMAEK